MTEIEALKQKIEQINSRNDSVSTDKAWETSYTRKVFVTICTYFVVWSYLAMISVTNAHLHALVPAGAFLLSTLTLPYAKKFWQKKIYKK